jgi:serine/threonine protein kinase
MLTGMPPYYSKDREKLFHTIKTEQVKFPNFLSKEAVDILTKLFIKDPEKRLGSGPNGLEDIKSQPFFSSINWDSILEKKIKPPFTPKLRSETDTRYIDPDFTSLAPTDSYHAGESLNDNENPFVGFSYDANKEGDKQQSAPQI